MPSSPRATCQHDPWVRSLWKISTGAWAAFQRSRQLPLNPWVCCRSRTFSSGEIVDRIGADGGRPGELMRIVNSAIYGLLGGSAAFRCRDLRWAWRRFATSRRTESIKKPPRDGVPARSVTADLGVTVSLAACSRSKEISCAGVGRQGVGRQSAVDRAKTAGLVDNSGGRG